MRDNFKVGDTESVTKTFTEREVAAFASLSGDENPIHLDEEAAKASGFGKRIVHGMFVSSLFSTLLASKLPGPGTIYLSQTLKFLAPVFLDDQITASVEVIDVRDDKPIMRLRTYCKNTEGNTVIEGEAVVKFSKQRQ